MCWSSQILLTLQEISNIYNKKLGIKKETLEMKDI